MGDWKIKLKGLSRKVPKDDAEYLALIETLEGIESDRGCVLIAGSMLEAALEVALRSRIVVLAPKVIDSIFGYEAPLGTFSAKISVAYAFGLIDSDINDDLTRIRLIRNAFAHAKVAIDFSTPEVDLACQPFNSLVTRISKLKISDFPGTRSVFNAAIAILLTFPNVANVSHANGTPRAITYSDIEASLQKFP